MYHLNISLCFEASGLVCIEQRVEPLKLGEVETKVDGGFVPD